MCINAHENELLFYLNIHKFIIMFQKDRQRTCKVTLFAFVKTLLKSSKCYVF